LNRNYPKEEIHMANRYVKRCLISLIIKETQIKATKRNHLNLLGWLLSMQKTTNKQTNKQTSQTLHTKDKCGQSHGGIGDLVHCW
jgi:hypothetical protein